MSIAPEVITGFPYSAKLERVFDSLFRKEEQKGLPKIVSGLERGRQRLLPTVVSGLVLFGASVAVGFLYSDMFSLHRLADEAYAVNYLAGGTAIPWEQQLRNIDLAFQARSIIYSASEQKADLLKLGGSLVAAVVSSKVFHSAR